MNIALVDDRTADRTHLEEILREYDSMHQLGLICYHYASGEDLLKAYQPFKFTVIFLDVYMDGITGTETAQKLREADDDVILVFLTTSEEHRSDAFSVFATAYLSKPCSAEAVFRTMDHILRIHTDRGARFSFSFDRRDYSLPFSEIVSLETDGNYLSITDHKQKQYRTRMTFSAAERQLDSRFLTLMKGIIVNMDYVSQITESHCLLQNGTQFPIHVKSRKELRQRWLNYKFTKIRKATAELGGKNHV